MIRWKYVWEVRTDTRVLRPASRRSVLSSSGSDSFNPEKNLIFNAVANVKEMDQRQKICCCLEFNLSEQLMTWSFLIETSGFKSFGWLFMRGKIKISWK